MSVTEGAILTAYGILAVFTTNLSGSQTLDVELVLSGHSVYRKVSTTLRESNNWYVSNAFYDMGIATETGSKSFSLYVNIPSNPNNAIVNGSSDKLLVSQSKF
jgi:hypothetical protein